MTPEHRTRWETEISRIGNRLKSPRDLLFRAVPADDFIDSAIIGGISVAEIIHGKIAEWQIPPDVVDAFHRQYPQYGQSFVEAVNHLSADPARLMGLINGVKGKLFEIDYVTWLNAGHMPAGHTAELAANANNPAWDILIRDSHGHVNKLLQVKASENVEYVRQAISAHPNIDVVVPHELSERITQHGYLSDHLVDSHQSLMGVNHSLADATSHAEAAGIHFHLPFIAITFAVAQNFLRYRKQEVTLEQAVMDAGRRGSLAVLASGVSWAVAHFTGSAIVSAPIGFVTRLMGGQVVHNLQRRDALDDSLVSSGDSIRQLRVQLRRPFRLDAAT